MNYENITTIIFGLLIVIALIASLIFRSKKKEIILLLISIFFAMVLAELMLSRFYPQIHQSPKLFEHDASLGWRFIVNKSGSIAYPGEAHHYIQINSWGFRDGRVDPDIHAKRKLLVLGDSFVSNFAVADVDVFTEIMERRLIGTTVLNFGVNGYGPVQSYLLLRRWFNKIHPDVIIMLIYIRNDFKDNLGGFWRYPRPFVTLQGNGTVLRIHPPPPFKPEDSAFHPYRFFYTRSHLFNLVDRNLSLFIHRFSKREPGATSFSPPELYLCRTELSENTKLMYGIMETLLMEFNRYGKRRNTPVVFVLAPSLLQVEKNQWTSALSKFGVDLDGYRPSLPNEMLMQFARENNLFMVDLLPAMQAETQGGNILYHRKEQHWNHKGNRVAAEVLLGYLRRHRLIRVQP